MHKYKYKAINELGKPIRGFLDADNFELANEALVSRGQTPVWVKECGSMAAAWANSALVNNFRRVHARDLILFTKQLSTMIRTGVPIIRCMEILESQSESRKLKQIVRTLGQDLKEGVSLSNALRRYPDTFPPLYTSMVYAGERSGSLPAVLDRLNYIIEHEHKVKSDIRAALSYPIMVVVCLVIAFIILLHYVVPRFAKVFERIAIELPLPTKICLVLSNWLDQYWMWLFGGTAVLVLLLGAFFRTDAGRYFRDVSVLRTPLIGPVLVKAAISRFASIFAILQATGVAILDSMQILSGTMGNAAISKEVKTIQDMLEEGKGIAQPLASAKYFTPMLINMVAIGEESGTLDEMLREVSKHYDSEVEYAMKRMSDAIGPILIISLAAVVGFFALAIYLPMWDITKIVR